MRVRSLICALALAAATMCPLAWSSNASAESGAHRQPPPPPDAPALVVADAR